MIAFNIPGIDCGDPARVWHFFEETTEQRRRGRFDNVHMREDLPQEYEPLQRFYDCCNSKRYPIAALWKNFTPAMQALQWFRDPTGSSLKWHIEAMLLGEASEKDIEEYFEGRVSAESVYVYKNLFFNLDGIRDIPGLMYKYIWYPAIQKSGALFLYDYVWKYVVYMLGWKWFTFMVSPEPYPEEIEEKLLGMIERSRIMHVSKIQNESSNLPIVIAHEKVDRFLAGTTGGIPAKIKQTQEANRKQGELPTDSKLLEMIQEMFDRHAPRLKMLRSRDKLGKKEFVDNNIKYKDNQVEQ